MTKLQPWHAALAGELGLAEVPGPKSAAKIMAMAREVAKSDRRLDWIAGFYEDDDIPWCGLAVAWACVRAGIAPVLPNPLSARAWAQWGTALAAPVPGAILVFARVGGGHVGIYEGENAANYLVLGGNQSNRIGRDPIRKSRLLCDGAGRPIGIRWPAGVPVPAEAGRVAADLAGRAASQNER